MVVLTHKFSSWGFHSTWFIQNYAGGWRAAEVVKWDDFVGIANVPSVAKLLILLLLLVFVFPMLPMSIEP